MHKKSVIFGIGIGVLAMVLVSLAAYAIQRGAHRDEVASLHEMLEYERAVVPPQPDVDDLMNWARELGMVFAHEILEEQAEPAPQADVAPEPEPDEEPEPIALAPPEEPSPIEAPTPTNPPSPPVAPQGSVWVHIPVDVLATDIVNILGDAGVVENRGAFLVFLIDNNFDRAVMAGNFLMPVNGNFQEILDIIRLPN